MILSEMDKYKQKGKAT